LVGGDDALRIADKMRAVGCQVEIELWQHMCHDWHMNMRAMPEAKAAIARIATTVHSVSVARGDYWILDLDASIQPKERSLAPDGYPGKLTVYPSTRSSRDRYGDQRPTPGSVSSNVNAEQRDQDDAGDNDSKGHEDRYQASGDRR
jgi:hypothetical protein